MHCVHLPLFLLKIPVRYDKSAVGVIQLGVRVTQLGVKVIQLGADYYTWHVIIGSCKYREVNEAKRRSR